jgi:hypothetical protein
MMGFNSLVILVAYWWIRSTITPAFLNEGASPNMFGLHQNINKDNVGLLCRAGPDTLGSLWLV